MGECRRSAGNSEGAGAQFRDDPYRVIVKKKHHQGCMPTGRSTGTGARNGTRHRYCSGHDVSVHYPREEAGMKKNITLSAEESLIERAREVAARQNKSLNAAFRDWLSRFVGAETAEDRYKRLMGRLDRADAGRRFSREEMNER
jgi:hypothetical protein